MSRVLDVSVVIGQRKLYAEAIWATRLAMSAGGELKGICWHQGEANAKRVSLYSGQLKVLVENFRKDLGGADLPFVFAQIGQWEKKYEEFNRMIVKQDALIEHTACVKTDGLNNFDAAHFDAAAQRVLGKLYAEKMFKLLDE